jgi:hypothetical protein
MLHSRNPNALIGTWIGGLLFCAIVFWFSHRAPAFEDLLTPVYWIVGIILIAYTTRWIRSRTHPDRRAEDRRRAARRGPD